MRLARLNMLPPFTDMLVFPVLFGLALAYRRRPAAHKRLMVLACTMLLIAGAERMTFLGSPVNRFVVDFIWLSPVWIAMIRDYRLLGRVHPVYLIGFPLLALIPFRMMFVDAPVWVGFTDYLAARLT